MDEGFWLTLGYFVVPICIWWLVNFVAEARHRALRHHRIDRTDLWLLFAAIVWGLLTYAVATRLLPIEFYSCFEGHPDPELRSFLALCGRTKPAYFWAATGLATAFYLIGLIQRLRVASRRG